MWPALFPELTRRHAWFGYADSDILFGNISAMTKVWDTHWKRVAIVAAAS